MNDASMMKFGEASRGVDIDADDDDDDNLTMMIVNGKLVKTSMGCVGVSKETIANIEINWYTVSLRIKY